MDPVFNDTATYTAQVEDSNFSEPIKSDIENTVPTPKYRTFDLNNQNAATTSQKSGVEANTMNVIGSVAAGQILRAQGNPSIATAEAPHGNADDINPQAYLPFSNVASAQATSNPFPNPQITPQTLQNFQIANQIAPASSTSVPHTGNEPLGATDTLNQDQAASSQEVNVHDDGVNFQTLLDNLSRSTSTAPPTESMTAPTTATSLTDPHLAQTSDEKVPPVVAGLPPRPPPQEKPSIHPNYSPNESIRSYHQMPVTNPNPPQYQSLQNAGSSSTYSNGSTLPPPPVQSGAPGTTPGNALPPPPSFPTYPQVPPGINTQQTPAGQVIRESDAIKTPVSRLESDGEDEDIRWGPDVQVKYDKFLQDERIYVTEGVWDRFPPGSRLFVGNLPTEKVTKRDLFHIFHKHGKLAQISIKQAYGFVQFLEATGCYEALDREQGVAIRGRKIHLEVSKPQKNSRNSGPAEHLKQSNRRRSRSPNRRGGGRHGNDRNPTNNRPPFSDFRDEPARRRDDYRPVRSPSPRGRDGRASYRIRDRSPGRYGSWDERTMSPVYGKPDLPSRVVSYDADADLPIPRRYPQDVPDVQILILEEVDRSKSLRTDVLTLSPRITLQPVIKRQVLEGVQAVVKLTHLAQLSGKVALQVFDRSSGVENVNFNEYEGLEISVAADIVIHSKQSQVQRAPPSAQYTGSQTAQYGASAQYTPSSVPSYSAQPVTGAGQPNIANMISNLDGASLQKLLGSLQQPQGQQQILAAQQTPVSTPSNPNAPDLASLLSNVARQQHQNPVAPPPSQPLNRGNGYGYGVQPSGQAPSAAWSPPPHGGNAAVQNLMDQLSRYR
ncbi:MAG: hypothetical protein Q9160_000322 [Pyrenula sp. 1 TL-2023]